MFKIIKEKEPIIVKEVTETKNKSIKKLKENIPLADHTEVRDDFFNILICITSITRNLAEKVLMTEEFGDKINEQKQVIINAIATISDLLGITNELGEYKEIKLDKKKLIKEELKQAEYYEFDVIPLLRFQEIQENLNTVIDGYFEVGENITYEKTNEIATDLTRIENAIDNIATTIGNELKNNLIYKK